VPNRTLEYTKEARLQNTREDKKRRMTNEKEFGCFGIIVTDFGSFYEHEFKLFRVV